MSACYDLIHATIKIWWKLGLVEVVLYFTLVGLAMLVQNQTGFTPFVVGVTYQYGGSLLLALLPLVLVAVPIILYRKATAKGTLFATMVLSLVGFIVGAVLVWMTTGIAQRLSDAVRKL